MAFSNFVPSFLLFNIFITPKAFSNAIKPFVDPREIPYEENEWANGQYPRFAGNYPDESHGSRYDSAYSYPEDYSRNNYQSRANYYPNYGNYGPTQDFDEGYSRNGNFADDLRNNIQVGKMPNFLRSASKSGQQSFMALEQEDSRARTSIESQKMGWAKRNGVRIKNLYVQFASDVKAGSERFMQNRKQILVGLSRQARDLDRKIQVIVSDQKLSRQQCLIRINSLLSASTDQTRRELRENLRVISPLDGNFPPIQSKMQNRNDRID